MKNARLSVVIFSLILFFGALACPKTAFGQVFTLSPSTATKSAGTEFSVDLLIDTGGKVVSAADVKLSFDAGVLQIVDVAEGSFFPQVSHNIYSGTMYVGGVFVDESEYKSGTGKLATLTLKGKTPGTASLAFVCTSQATDTNILDSLATPTDIVKCSSLKNASYTFTGSSSTTPTPTVPAAGLGGDAGATPTPEPPVTGVSLPTLFSVGFGLALVIFGVAFLF
ncbi:MAG: cohesin domain-containing protein [Patescibacteria group bacterium]|jgi:hypothetical protein